MVTELLIGAAVVLFILGVIISAAEEDDGSGGSTSTSKARGTVNFFNESGGYGYIETTAAQEDVFFHMDNIRGPDLREGQQVAFEIVPSDKGPRAQNIDRL